jgi:hypothetical protein
MEPDTQLKLIALGLWALLIYRSAKPYHRSISSNKWPQGKAIVTTSSIDRANNIYSPKIIYEYLVHGVRQLNDTYTYLGASSFTKSRAIGLAQSHPVGSEIVIFICPDDPKESVIVPGVHWLQYVSFLLVTLFCVFLAFIDPIFNFIWPGCEPNCT